MQADDPRLFDAKRKAIKDVAHSLGLHWLTRGCPEIHGHCPKCGGAEKRGSDRFWIDVVKNSFGCRKCQTGGDVIALVRFVKGLSFPQALEWLCGPLPESPETPEERKKRLEKEEADRKKDDAEAARYRAQSIASARSIWQAAQPPQGTLVEAYLARRAIDTRRLGGVPKTIRFHPALRYTVDEVVNKRKVRRVIHTGPAMLAAVQGPDGRFSAVHRTWLDLDQPKGKAVIIDPKTGERMESKKVLGSKKGGAIRLTHTRQSATLVMGEGIETTASAWLAAADQGWMFWAGVDMGNMSGRQLRVPGQRYSGMPDLDDAEAFVPPPGVTRLVYVMDGDSDPVETRAKMLAGLRRAMARHPGLRGQIAPTPDGKDLNDVLMGVE